jgi:hypothetical protein
VIGTPGPDGTTWDPDACASPGCGHPWEGHQHHRKGTDCSRAGCDCLRYRPQIPWPLSMVRRLIRRARP